MNRRLVFLTDGDASYGFELAGFDQITATVANAVELLDTVIANPAYGLLVVDERLFSDQLERRLHEIQDEWDGVIVTLPPPAMTRLSREDYAMKLMRQAIGYHVRIELDR